MMYPIPLWDLRLRKKPRSMSRLPQLYSFIFGGRGLQLAFIWRLFELLVTEDLDIEGLDFLTAVIPIVD